MIKRVLLGILILFALAFILMWILSGGFQNIKAAVNHYRNPLHYHNLFEYIFQIGSTTGETFKVPGTPSTYPMLKIGQHSTSTMDVGPTTVYESGSTGGDGGQ